MTKAGVLLDTNGLRPITEATKIIQSGGAQTVLDGPFTESKEVVGGYCILQVKSKEEAVEWTSRFLGAHGPARPRMSSCSPIKTARAGTGC
ncbi:YciI family protein [Nocardia sp. NBC_00881]|nr:YciI family protein [Nocardia sp. NBC_00881]